MHIDYYRNMIIRAVETKDEATLDALARRFAMAEDVHSILRHKGYGVQGMELDAVARQVPVKK